MKNKKLPLLDNVKNIKKLLLIILCVVLVIVVAIVIAIAIKKENIKKMINETYDGKCYMRKIGEYQADFYAFKDGQFATEFFASYEKKGDITAFSDYTIKTSLFSNSAWIVLNGKTELLFELSDGEIGFAHYTASDMENIKIKDIEKYRSELLCGGHEFEEEVLIEATCIKAGKVKKVCKKCAVVENVSYTGEHKYYDGVCKYCAKTKPREKTDLLGNHWYTHEDISSLYMQNLLVSIATPRAKGESVFVSGYCFCASCKTIDVSQIMVVPSFENAVERLYHCDVCGEVTTVKVCLK